jgi:hypothetical protein
MTEHPYDVEVNPWVGGRQRFEMVSEADPSVRTGHDDERTRWCYARARTRPARPSWAARPGR